MKKFLQSDYFLMFASVAVAVFLWIYVSYGQSPTHETWVRGVTVTYTNETSDLESGKLVILDGNIKTADLKLRGSRTALASVKASNIVCNVNLGEIKSEGNYHIPLAVNVGVDGVEIVQKSPYSVALVVDRVVTEEREVVANKVGEPKAEYILGEMEINPDVVKLTGPKSVIEEIHSVSATVDVTDVWEDVEGLYKIKLYNQSGKEIVDERVSKNIEYCDVKCPVLYSKDVKIVPVLSDETNINGDSITVSVITPETIAISGNKEVIENITELYTQEINTSQILESKTVEVPVDLSAYSENVVVKTDRVSVTLEPEISPETPQNTQDNNKQDE